MLTREIRQWLKDQRSLLAASLWPAKENYTVKTFICTETYKTLGPEFTSSL